MNDNSRSLRRIWLVMEVQEVIELKQMMMDHDEAGAAAFFERVIVPRVRQAARQRGIQIEKRGDGQV